MPPEIVNYILIGGSLGVITEIVFLLRLSSSRSVQERTSARTQILPSDNSRATQKIEKSTLKNAAPVQLDTHARAILELQHKDYVQGIQEQESQENEIFSSLYRIAQKDPRRKKIK